MSRESVQSYSSRGRYRSPAPGAVVLQVFGVNDYNTADMLSKKMGRKPSHMKQAGNMKLTKDTLLLMRAGENPLIVKKLRYFAD